jgi:hypothetical protein
MCSGPCSLSEQLAAAQRLTNLIHLHLRMGWGIASALPCLALLPQLFWLELVTLEGVDVRVDTDQLRPLKQLRQLHHLSLEGISLREYIP